MLKGWLPLVPAGITSADADNHCFILPQAVKAPRRKEDVAVCVVQLLPHKTIGSNDSRYLLVQRPSTGLLAGVCPQNCLLMNVDTVHYQQAFFISAQHACHLTWDRLASNDVDEDGLLLACVVECRSMGVSQLHHDASCCR